MEHAGEFKFVSMASTPMTRTPVSHEARAYTSYVEMENR
jgi:hypothetical protein